jgi:hypothetical protein
LVIFTTHVLSEKENLKFVIRACLINLFLDISTYLTLEKRNIAVRALTKSHGTVKRNEPETLAHTDSSSTKNHFIYGLANNYAQLEDWIF